MHVGHANSCHKFLGAYTFKAIFPNARSILQCYRERMTMASVTQRLMRYAIYEWIQYLALLSSFMS